MKEERFKACESRGLNISKIFDEHNSNCPICDIKFNSLKQAEEIADWLNLNIKQYQRFVLIEYLDRKGHESYRIWDNKLNEPVPFVPLIESSCPRSELMKFVKYLNSIGDVE